MHSNLILSMHHLQSIFLLLHLCQVCYEVFSNSYMSYRLQTFCSSSICSREFRDFYCFIMITGIIINSLITTGSLISCGLNRFSTIRAVIILESFPSSRFLINLKSATTMSASFNSSRKFQHISPIKIDSDHFCFSSKSLRLSVYL